MQTLLGNGKEGLAFILSAPAGTGKTTLVSMLVTEFPCVVESISWTTRKPRPGEVQGVHYHFTSEEEFKHKIERNDFLEYVQLYGNYYGTDYKTVQQQLKAGKHVVLVIDTQGAIQLKGKFPAVFIFLQPPTMDVLRQRLNFRKTEEDSVIEQRLLVAKKEMEAIKYYDYSIVNDDLQISYEVLRSIFIAEEHRIIK